MFIGALPTLSIGWEQKRDLGNGFLSKSFPICYIPRNLVNSTQQNVGHTHATEISLL